MLSKMTKYSALDIASINQMSLKQIQGLLLKEALTLQKELLLL